MSEKHPVNQRNIKTAMHTEPKRKENDLVTVIEGPLDRVQVSLEEITRNKKADITLGESRDEPKIKQLLKIYDGSEVYINEKNEEGEILYLHGVLVVNSSLSPAYKLRLINSQNLPEVHYAANLRRMIVK
jgi:hypothetical protein